MYFLSLLSKFLCLLISPKGVELRTLAQEALGTLLGLTPTLTASSFEEEEESQRTYSKNLYESLF